MQKTRVNQEGGGTGKFHFPIFCVSLENESGYIVVTPLILVKIFGYFALRMPGIFV